MSYCVNGWDEEFDNRTGERYYRCHDCQRREGTGHDKDCYRYVPKAKRAINKRKARVNRVLAS